jgi:ribonuclease PH
VTARARARARSPRRRPGDRRARRRAAARAPDGRTPRQARPLKIERGVLPHAEGSALSIMGRTRVLCTATVEDRVPNWIRGKGKGWVTAEYGMLPRSTGERTPRSARPAGARRRSSA